jgi:glutathione peroxidase-family protein/predicted MPP superfamily phosphohydrolase
MFGSILTAFFTLMLFYVLLRAHNLPFCTRHASTKTFVGCGLVLWATFILGRLLGHDDTGWISFALDQIAMLLLGAVFLLTTTLLVSDLLTLLIPWFRRRKMSLRAWAFSAGFFLLGLALYQGLRAPVVVPYEVTLQNLPASLDGTVLAVVSDAHLGGVLEKEWFDQRMEQVQALQPNLVLFLGDIFEGHGDDPTTLPCLDSLHPSLGKWYVPGNHESHGNNGMTPGVLENSGFQRLANRWAEVAPGLVLSGVEDLTQHARQNNGSDPLGQTLSSRPQGALILLSHSPLQTDRAAQAGVGLMLSGHTHDGQLWPFSLLVRQVYPFIAGRYDIGSMTLLVSRGMGTWGPRLRLWHPAEILRVTLHRTPPTGTSRSSHFPKPPAETNMTSDPNATVYPFVVTLNNGQPKPLADYKGKVLLIVNTASQCGFTPQYKGLQALYEKYKGKGFEVLGFPCDQFGHQEPGSDTEIKGFCELNFGVTFPIFKKIEVNGKGADPLYVFLKSHAPGFLNDAIKWNFTKFLVDRQGKVVGRYASATAPEGLTKDLEKLLGSPSKP